MKKNLHSRSLVFFQRNNGNKTEKRNENLNTEQYHLLDGKPEEKFYIVSQLESLIISDVPNLANPHMIRS